MKEKTLDALQELLSLLETPDLPSLGSNLRASREELGTLNAQIDASLQKVKLDRTAQNLIRAVVLLWHDHLDGSHSLSQEIHNADGSFVHGIMHRREPDYGNAKYWFRRVGQHAAFSELVSRTSVLLESKAENTVILTKDTYANGLFTISDALVRENVNTLKLAGVNITADKLFDTSVLAEIVSFSRVIERVPPLRAFDRLGQRPERRHA